MSSQAGRLDSMDRNLSDQGCVNTCMTVNCATQTFRVHCTDIERRRTRVRHNDVLYGVVIDCDDLLIHVSNSIFSFRFGPRVQEVIDGC